MGLWPATPILYMYWHRWERKALLPQELPVGKPRAQSCSWSLCLYSQEPAGEESQWRAEVRERDGFPGTSVEDLGLLMAGIYNYNVQSLAAIKFPFCCLSVSVSVWHFQLKIPYNARLMSCTLWSQCPKCFKILFLLFTMVEPHLPYLPCLILLP